MAKKNKYIWRLNDKLPTINDHSLVKLEIIEKYLEAYMRHLSIHPLTKNLNFAIIDGFCGGGLYTTANQKEILGSPLRILETIEKLTREINIQKEIQKLPTIKFNIPIYLIEKSKDTFNFLQHTLRERNLDEKCKIFNAEFQNIYLRIIQELQKQKFKKAIFILDQYGYADATIHVIQNILQNFKNAEIILTFACDSLIDYLSVKNKKTLINLGLNTYDIEYLLDTKQDDDTNRKTLQYALLDSIVKHIGTCFYTPFFIRGKETHRAYWLLHFSNHPTARNEMVKLHYENHNAFIHYGGNGLDMFGYSTRDAQTLPFLFAEEDRKKSLNSIMKIMPDKIKKYDNQTFETLIKNEINKTPASIEMIQESLKEPLHYGDIKIIDNKTKNIIKNYKNIKLDSIIKDTKQQRFKF